MTLKKKNTKFSFVIHGFLGKNSKNGGDKQTFGKKRKFMHPTQQTRGKIFPPIFTNGRNTKTTSTTGL